MNHELVRPSSLDAVTGLPGDTYCYFSTTVQGPSSIQHSRRAYTWPRSLDRTSVPTLPFITLALICLV